MDLGFVQEEVLAQSGRRHLDARSSWQRRRVLCVRRLWPLCQRLWSKEKGRAKGDGKGGRIFFNQHSHSK